MAKVIRFRPLLLGDPAAPAAVYLLLDGRNGNAVLREKDLPLPLDAPLERVHEEHLPSMFRRQDLRVTILPLQEVSGATPEEAWGALDADVESLYAREADAPAERELAEIA